MVICLDLGADLHMVQLMPLPLTVSCFSTIHIGFTFLVPAHLGSPGKRAVKWVCVCVIYFNFPCRITVASQSQSHQSRHSQIVNNALTNSRPALTKRLNEWWQVVLCDVGRVVKFVRRLSHPGIDSQSRDLSTVALTGKGACRRRAHS